MGCYNSTVINAPTDQVWKKLRDFHDMSWAAGVIESSTAVGSKGPSEPGAQRILNNAFHETLKEIDDQTRSLRYSIDDGPAAISKDNVRGYIGEVRVFDVTDTGGSFILWTSEWEASGGGVAEFCNPIYQALLSALKKAFNRPEVHAGSRKYSCRDALGKNGRDLENIANGYVFDHSGRNWYFPLIGGASPRCEALHFSLRSFI